MKSTPRSQAGGLGLGISPAGEDCFEPLAQVVERVIAGLGHMNFDTRSHIEKMRPN